ncbi:hypothetical protein [Halorubrum sp. SD612]|uniref:DUF7575 domain-containing protein n=1 Tax=Halorubrum sp. SD612 TaxID=1855863 RepID=UPI000A2D15E8|nr:hypothetical protein [Halorubrum sp. SD612]OTF10399.1 hypothetical protein B9G38_06260 [Halorubrum sp. SD612]
MSEHTRRRPWLAALLALVVSGLGHAYLRRWARAFGWYVAVTAAVFAFVPESAISGALAGDPPALRDVAPAAAVVGASVVDAYVVALRNNRAYERERGAARATDTVGPAVDGAKIDSDAVSDATAVSSDSRTRCPACGKETDSAVDFCQWCAEPLGGDENE